MITNLVAVRMNFITGLIWKQLWWHPMGGANPGRTFVTLALENSCNTKVTDLDVSFFMD